MARTRSAARRPVGSELRKDVSSTLAKKIRVYELARELGLTNKEALDLCIDLGIGVKSHSSSIEDAHAKAKGCPLLKAGGTIELAQAMDM